VLVTSEFLPASVLPTMAADLAISEGTAGLAVAATAIAGALTAPSIAVLLPRTDRRTVLVGLLVAAIVANLAVAVAPGLAVLLLGRLVLGVAIAGFWSFAFSAGIQAVPGRDSVISTSLALGVTGATIGGVPLASVVGDEVGWRTVFGAAAALSAIAALAVAVALPPVPPHPSAGLAMMRRAIANRRLMAGVVGVVLVAFGNFAAYPFIRIAIGELDPSSTAGLMLAWGFGGLVGNLAAGRLAGRLRFVVATAPLLLGASLVLTTAAPSLPLLVIGVVGWGLAFNMVPVATQLWVTRVDPERAESAVALQVTAFQMAIALGSALGGALLDTHGVTAAFLLGTAFAVAAGLVFAVLRVPGR
jgi:predicted MFS family arabinose efflux permease